MKIHELKLRQPYFDDVFKNKIMSCGKLHFVKRKSDGKILQIRLCKILKDTNDGDFDLIWQFLEKGKWKTDNNICSPQYNFHVREDEIKDVQLLIEGFS